jgi:molybdenum-dependent DNA-binding transcriptional regulator ModE
MSPSGKMIPGAKMALKIAMGQKDLLRSKEMELVKQKKQTIKAAGLKLKLSYRQAKRIYAAYLSSGDAALVHGNTGKRSNHKIAAQTRESVLQAYRERYDDFGPTFAVEKLAEVEDITVSVSTMRRWMLAEGLWSRKRQSSEYRSRRERRESFGELIQFDGSHHRWFEGRGLKCCLITLIDDATNTRLSQFFDEETTAGAMTVLTLWIKKYGIPAKLCFARRFIATKKMRLCLPVSPLMRNF